MTAEEKTPRAPGSVPGTPCTGKKESDGKKPGNKPPHGWHDPRALAGLPAGAPLGIALSGGADSVALLLLTPPPVAAVHVHHGIRGAEADRDAEFCRRLCERKGIPLTVLYTDVPARAKQTGEGLETAARAERYRLFAEFAAESGVPAVLTAHHADDQLETLLLHLLRGSGLRGMCGIPAVRQEGSLLLIRPMLEMQKEEILAFLTARKEAFVTDSTNGERGCTRNRLRLDVVPALREIAPDAAAKAAAAARLMSTDEQWMEETAAAFLQEQGKEPPAAALAALPRPIFVRVIQHLFTADLCEAHFTALSDLVAGAVPHSSLSLPHGKAGIEDGRLTFRRTPERIVPDYGVPLSQGAEFPFPAGQTELPEVPALVVAGSPSSNPLPAPKKLYKYATSVSFLSDNIKGRIILRNRRAGDRLLSGGMHRAVRKLPELLALPPEVRRHMPMLTDENGILAIPFCPVRDGADGKTRNDVTVWFYFD